MKEGKKEFYKEFYNCEGASPLCCVLPKLEGIYNKDPLEVNPTEEWGRSGESWQEKSWWGKGVSHF